MELLGLPFALCLAGFFLIVVLGGGLLLLVKLGVFAQYALKDEPPEYGDYGLDQSHEADDE